MSSVTPHSTSPKKCLVRGSINIDEFYHVPQIVRPGQTISASSTSKRLGGKGGNQAKALACAGGWVVMDATVGDDAEGQWAVQGLCEIRGGEGRIESGRIGRWNGGVTGKAVIQVAEDGENSIIILAGANHARSTPYSPLLPPSTSHLLLANEIPLPSTLTYLSSAFSSGITTIFNPSPMLTEPQIREFPWAQVDWLLVNEGELQEIVTILSPFLSLRPGDEPFHTYTRALSTSLGGKSNIICTLGARGVYVYPAGAQGKAFELPCGRLEGPVRDTTGAGDCFAGYFVAGLMRLQEAGVGLAGLEGVVRECMTACAMCVEKEGAQDSYPIREEVLARMG